MERKRNRTRMLKAVKFEKDRYKTRGRIMDSVYKTIPINMLDKK